VKRSVAAFVPLGLAVLFVLSLWPRGAPPEQGAPGAAAAGRSDRPDVPRPDDAMTAEAPPPDPSRSVPDGVDLDSEPPVRPRWPPPPDAEFDDDASGAQSVAPASDACKLRELRGWLRVQCTIPRASLQLLGGSAEGLYMHAEGGEFATVVSATMPLLPGDRRVLQLDGFSPEYGGQFPMLSVFSECWVGTRGPHLALTKPESFF
jgi:hypothetical protein